MKAFGSALGATIVSFAFAGGAVATAPSMSPDMPDEIKSWREEILPKPLYEELVTQWRDYVGEHPGSAVAHVQLARALRYARMGSPDEGPRLIERALELDPDCPEALLAVAERTATHADPESVIAEFERAHGQVLRAVALAPSWPDPHFTGWGLCISLKMWEESHEHLRSILRKGAYPAAIVDFGYNLLASAEPNAIILTNGDNDTYPPLALQALHGIRSDVAIVNLSLLNRVGYAEEIWGRTLAEGPPFGELEVRELYRRWKEDDEGEMFSTWVMRALIERVRSGTWSGPVYLASTVSPYHLERCGADLEIEGLLWRVTRDEKREAGAEPRTNLERTLYLFDESFRLDSLTDLSYSWPENSSAGRMIRNYAAVLQYVAGAAAEQGRLGDVRRAMDRAIRLMEFHGDEEMVRQMKGYMKELDSGDRD